MQIVDQVSNVSLPVERNVAGRSRYGGRTFEVLLGLATFPVLALFALGVLKIVKIFFKSFGSKEAASKFAYSVRKFELLYVEHKLLWTRSYVRLLNMSNMASAEVLRTGADTQAALRMRDEFLEKNQLLQPNQLERLIKTSCYGAQTEGICFGAAKVIVKACLEAKIESEAELIEVLSQFENGFNAEASGFQKVYMKTNVFNEDVCQRSLVVCKKELDELDASYNAYSAAVGQRKEELRIQNLECSNRARRSVLLHETPLRIAYYNSILQLMGLCLTNQPDKPDEIFFDSFKDDEDVQKRFNDCPNGMYTIGFATENSGHALAYLKFDFGSYFVDPALGLMKRAETASAKLLQLLEYNDCTSQYRFEMYNHYKRVLSKL